MLADDLNSIVSNWEDLFWAAVDDFVPKKKISGKQVPPWIDAEVKALCHKKDKMSRKALKENDQVYIDKFKSLRKDVKKLIRLKYNTYIKNWLTKLSRTQRSFGTFIAVKLSLVDSLQPLEETYLMLILYSILLTKLTYLTTIFTQFLIMLIMNLLHLVAMQKFLFLSAYLILQCLHLMS